jgi:hypothetical protein
LRRVGRGEGRFFWRGRSEGQTRPVSGSGGARKSGGRPNYRD